MLFDQHMHCECSMDSSAPLSDMVKAAAEHGMARVCFTDHVDMDDPRTGARTSAWKPDVPAIREAHASYRADAVPGIEVRMGIELGEPNHDPIGAREAADAAPWDLVLGSIHNLRDTPDFYFLRYASEEDCVKRNRTYLAELAELAAMDCYDVMAHIGYTSRYMRLQGFSAEVTAELYPEELQDVFRKLIRGGRGLEVNTSGLRKGHTTYPNASVLALYREMGGEIVTLGSDAHTPEDAGIGIREAEELLRTLGFLYVAGYKQRKPEFFRIG